MNCPICQQTLNPDASRSRTTSTKDKRTWYDKTVYHCERDDAWISVEVPQRTQQQQDTTFIAAE